MDRLERRFPNASIEFGERIRAARGDQLSQENLAELAGLHVTYVSGIENGRRNPSLDVLLRLATALGVPVEGLVSGLDQTD